MKLIRGIFIFLYALIAIFITICLLSYNEYKVTVFGEKSWLVMDSEKLEPEYKKGNLVIVDGSQSIKVGDEIFFYNNKGAITVAKVTNITEVPDTIPTYTLEGDSAVAGDKVIGNTKDVKQVENIGSVLRILQSKWGFLFLVVLPAILAFLYEIVEVFTELKGSKEDGGRSKTTK